MGWQNREGPKPPEHAYTGRQDRIEQAAATAAGHIERYFDDKPTTAELLKAKEALDRAVAVALGGPRR